MDLGLDEIQLIKYQVCLTLNPTLESWKFFIVSHILKCCETWSIINDDASCFGQRINGIKILINNIGVICYGHLEHGFLHIYGKFAQLLNNHLFYMSRAWKQPRL
jgi:hypothetical protein